MAYRLRAFEGRLRVKEKRHPKLYWIDPGLARAAKRHFGRLAMEERGALFEGFVVQQVRTYQSVRQDLYDEIYFWSVGSKQTSVEVDLVLERGSEIIAIEIKSGSSYQNNWCKGLSAISQLKGVRRKILVYCGERCFSTNDGIEVLSLQRFLELLRKGL